MSALPRQTVDLSKCPDLVVIYLGMRTHTLGGFLATMKVGPQIQKAVDAKPDGLLLHENIYFGFFPLHLGMRQYWRDFDSLEKWTRELPHKGWWKEFVSRPKGVSLWHETYSIRGGIESVFMLPYETGKRPGLLAFAPNVDAKGAMFSARRRLKREGAEPDPVVAE